MTSAPNGIDPNAPLLARFAIELIDRVLPFVVTPEWRSWVLERRLAGERSSDIVSAIAHKAQVPAVLAQRALALHYREFPDELLSRLGASRVPHASSLALMVRLRRELESQGDAFAIERIPTPPAEVFYGHYYQPNRPVVLADFAAQWPALDAWRFESLRETLGHHEVSITRGRAADPKCDLHVAKLTTHTSLAVYLTELIELGDTRTNDLYMIANNRNTENPGRLADLLESIVVPDGYFSPKKFRGSTSWWIGPAGTLTPMHHDTSNIVFTQVVGRKSITLVSAMHTELLDHARDGFYSDLRPDLLEEAGIPHYVVELEPGEALFIPVGWWHEVEALEPSVNLSFLNFAQPNHFEWYRPVRARSR